MFIQTEATPNPATLKFLPGKVVLEKGTAEFRNGDEAAASPLALRLFAVPGVTGVYFGYDFITVTKSDAEWQHLKPAILGTIMEHFMSGQPIMGGGSAMAEALDEEGEFFDDEDETIVETIKELLETRVRPAVAQDGGDITFKGYKDGTVYLNMKGACSGCPSSTATLKHGVQNLLKHFVPEVQAVEAL
ncbi:NifU family protein [Neorhizobium sp. NCHU2750]|uniref:NifU family protein n=1 Tax=Neorhizobium sp. NCHU2750 TaxID=1825976 RepID=UPI000E73DD32|nr:iron transporter [Neorhizobium sp. NCHU2750]